MNKIKSYFLFGGVVVTAFVFSFFAVSNSYAMISSSLDLGSTGSQVTELQTYLSTNVNIYPQGIISGYFGLLTQSAVKRFQTAQGIVSSGSPDTTGYGRVGPMTRARINSLLGFGVQQSWDTVPTLSNPVVTYTNTTATFTWTTNELTQGQVYWSLTPLQFTEEDESRQQSYVGGILALDAGGLQVNHTVTVSNLQANTTYYYLVRSIDIAGNVSIVWPSFFHTNQ